MVVVPLTQSTKNQDPAPNTLGIEVADWTRVLAAGAIVTGGLLLLTGWRRTGMLTAAAGTALTLLDQEETIRSWWSVVPGYIDDVQRVLTQVETTVDDIEAKRETLRQILSKRTPAEQPYGNS